MASDLDELTRVVGTMPHEMAREVLNFARYLLQKQSVGGDTADWDDDYGSRYGAEVGIGSYHPWDTADGPGVRDVA